MRGGVLLTEELLANGLPIDGISGSLVGGIPSSNPLAIPADPVGRDAVACCVVLCCDLLCCTEDMGGAGYEWRTEVTSGRARLAVVLLIGWPAY
jgi:hypothetical protein